MTLEAPLPCPGCGFMILAGRYGSYDICDFCGWEDDCVQLANPTSGGEANQRSLHEVQIAALERYPLHIRELKGVTRSDRWRPLSQKERAADRATAPLCDRSSGDAGPAF